MRNLALTVPIFLFISTWVGRSIDPPAAGVHEITHYRLHARSLNEGYPQDPDGYRTCREHGPDHILARR